MPSLGADMEAGTLIEWIKRPGDHVERGEAIAAVETQKGAIEIESFETGVLEDIRVTIGQRVPVGAVLAMIRTDEEASAANAPRSAPATPPAAAPSITRAAPAPESLGGEQAPVEARITPAARRRAKELNIDVAALQSDASGVIGLREIEQLARRGESGASGKTGKHALDLGEMRRVIAAAMARSWRETPHYYVSSTLDVEPLLVWLERANAQRPVQDRLHYAAPLIKATALALAAVQELNGHFGAAGFEPAEHVHLGVAIALRGGGLIAPAILDAGALELGDVMVRLNDLVTRVRSGRLRSLEMTSATATLTNLGEGTADTLQPIIYPPQVAIVGCGRIARRPWANETTSDARRTLTVTVGGDHRVSDGRAAARFLNHLDDLLQHPERL